MKNKFIIISSLLTAFIFVFAGCDEDVEKREAIIKENVEFNGQAKLTDYFWDGEDKCSGIHQGHLVTKPNKKAVLTFTGKLFVFGSDGCVPDPADAIYSFEGTYAEKNLNDNSDKNLNTEFTFTTCNNGLFKATGRAAIWGDPDTFSGGVTCYDNTGEIDIGYEFALKRTTPRLF